MASSSPTANTYLGHHREAVRNLMREWDQFELWPLCLKGKQILQALLDRKEKFHFSDSFFDVPDHPIKILPYPASQDVATYADVFQDLLKLNKGNANLIHLHNGRIAEETPPGTEVVNRLVQYITTRSREDYDKVLFPLTLPAYPPGDGLEYCGIARIELNYLVPPVFRERDRIFQIGSEGWTTALVPSPSVTTMHYDNMLCGKIIPHFFGKKLWFLCRPTRANMLLWDWKHANDHSRMLAMISYSPDLFVWISGEPSVMVIPPHCFHATLTFSLTCHSGLRVASDYWMSEMEIPLYKVSDRQLLKDLRIDEQCIRSHLHMLFSDLATWSHWAQKIEREPTKEELEIMKIFVDVIRVNKWGLFHYFPKLPKV